MGREGYFTRSTRRNFQTWNAEMNKRKEKKKHECRKITARNGVKKL